MLPWDLLCHYIDSFITIVYHQVALGNFMLGFFHMSHWSPTHWMKRRKPFTRLQLSSLSWLTRRFRHIPLIITNYILYVIDKLSPHFSFYWHTNFRTNCFVTNNVTCQWLRAEKRVELSSPIMAYIYTFIFSNERLMVKFSQLTRNKRSFSFMSLRVSTYLLTCS